MEISRLKEVDNDIFNTITDNELVKKKIVNIADDDYYHVDRGNA
jgi:hypothetical protein